MATDISLADYLEIRNAAFEWSESYDLKDWERLQKILAPSVRLDFRSLKGELHENLSPKEYAAILSSRPLLGDRTLKTQHLLGGAKVECQSDGIVKVQHQIRVAHQRYKDNTFTEVLNKGHGIGVTTHWYRKIDGVWKIEGVAPRLDWSEYDLFGTLAPPKES
ncbi:scytalone dehydratase [Histoplasma capsulatum G186AR]|uniref:Scytalone dehydratase n=2 Tax=Ajellomyces capsulatus TaxID=5037 RepID=C0NWA9_AJECG|nr:scytalone dehydratase [Histoplasma capsulatum G186AR]EEH04214.1 scytalone dehydratase [Histoplasma capsulatum G186AR]KAG5291166.1 scytalone dehydratase [Histoplasma capsulatum]QSS68469.1 scytalone dehydratase [Histoplasma capsulatum G186AR]